MRAGLIAIVVLGLLSAGLGVASAQDIDTRTGPPNGGVAFYALKTTSGVVIAAPASSDQLRSFSIAIENATGPVSTQGLVMGWSRDGWRAVGPVLYLSAPTVVADAGRIDVAFTPPTPIPVTPGRQYVIAVKGGVSIKRQHGPYVGGPGEREVGMSAYGCGAVPEDVRDGILDLSTRRLRHCAVFAGHPAVLFAGTLL